VLLTILAALAVAASVPLAALPRPPSAQPVVVKGDGGFHWGDAGIGAAAGFGVALVLVGAVALTGPTHRLRRTK
jgi:hypothetical protein